MGSASSKPGTEREYLVSTEAKSSEYGVDENVAESSNVATSSIQQTTWLKDSGFQPSGQEPRQLSTFFGVVVPCILSMFSVILFLRMGFIVGQAGLTQALIILFLAYIIIGLTVLSVCAISTNGAIEGGGAYFMISRALGPEFGGAIGLMFFLANVASAAMYVFGIVEAIGDYFGPNGEIHKGVIQNGFWLDFGYGSAILFVCFIVCLIGANIYAKATFIIFLIVMVSITSALVSFFAKKAFIMTEENGTLPQRCNLTSVNYTGFDKVTLHDNTYGNYTEDYTTGKGQDFISVFAVFFNGCIGINAGANMSGELKNPSSAIPKGTIIACCITWFIYLLLMIFISATTPRELLHCDYTFLMNINVWPPFIVVGIFASSLSAVLSQLIGASRILLALARDELFGAVLRPVTKTTEGGNPYVAVLVTWILVQVVLFAHEVNTIAPVVTIFFLFAYAAVDMSCLALEWASAPNFRPTFKYFSWHTCLLGVLSCVVMMFLIQPIYTSVSLLVLVILVVVIHYRVPTSSWGYITQALIFHQVRKYLLMLDVRKEHVKFWRPQILLLVKNPRTCCQLIDFINSIKKSGLYILGHVSIGQLSEMPNDVLQDQYRHWISLVEGLDVKAFIELTLSKSVREGAEHLLRISGLGGMKPNTLVLGFYDDCPPQDSFEVMNLFKTPEKRSDPVSEVIDNDEITNETASSKYFPPVGDVASASNILEEKQLPAQEYVEVIADAIKLRKNVCLGRYFYELDKKALKERRQRGEVLYIDVWAVNFLHPVMARHKMKPGSEDLRNSPSQLSSSMYGIPECSSFDVTSMFLMQMACILNMTPFWKKNVKLRVNLCSDVGSEDACMSDNEELSEFLNNVRIKAQIRTIPWEHTHLLPSYKEGRETPENITRSSPDIQRPPAGASNETPVYDPSLFHKEPQLHAIHTFEENPKEYLQSVNSLIKANSSDSAVTFLYLPSPPADEAAYIDYLNMLTAISDSIGPTLFIHGLSHVVSTAL